MYDPLSVARGPGGVTIEKGKMGQGALFWVVTLALSAVLGAIAVIDLRTFRIPDLLSLPLIAAGLLLTFAMQLLPFWYHLIGAAVGFSTLAGLGEWYFRRNDIDGLGLGDAKLFAAAGAWLGWQALPMVLLIAAIGGLGFAAARGLTGRHASIAFGPWLALGFWLIWLWQNLSVHVFV